METDGEETLPSHLEHLRQQGLEPVDQELALQRAKEFGRKYWRVFDMLAKESRD